MSLLVKKFFDTNIYRSLEILTKEYFECYINMRNDIKPVIGKDLFDLLIKGIGLMSKSYASKDKEVKLKYALELQEYMFEFETKMKILKDSLEMISYKKYGEIAITCGQIENQLNNWIKSLNVK